MGILEEINYLKNQGMDNKKISDKLQERGITPKAIDDALNQMKIKNAIYPEDKETEPVTRGNIAARADRNTPQALYSPKSMEIENNHQADFYTPPLMKEVEVPQYGESSNEEYYPQQGYEEPGGEGGGYDTETFIEIAEQVFSEKIKKEQRQIEALNEFATLAETKISNNHERIKRMETIIDKLQVAILEKIGSYGKNLESIKDEMEMMQDSFEKIVPKLHEISSGHNIEHHAQHVETKHHKKKK